jgi:tRNA pseudouridine55 synthase
MQGLLNLCKPLGWSSRDAVDVVQRLVRPEKAGHAGTLDPLATGVLIVCVGGATRLIEFVQQQRKYYEATFRLGCSSPSDDCETLATELPDAPVPSREALAEACRRMHGTQWQRPPAYSAVKIGGRRAYRLARAGETPEVAPRPVEIYSLKVRRYAYPELEISLECGSGAYVRSVGRDLAASLGTVALMTSLVRTQIGEFRLDDALDAASLAQPALDAALLPPAQAVAHLPQVVLNAAEVADLGRGRPLAAERLPPGATGSWAAVTAAGDLAAILAPSRDGRWKPARNFAQAL